MWYNPPVVVGVDLDTATVEQLLRAIYQFQVSSTYVFFSAVIFYFIFKALVWFLPKYWHKAEVGS